MKFHLGQNLAGIWEEVVALNIQKNRDISFISHNLIDFFYFEINVDLLVLFIYLLNKIILHIFLLVLLFLRGNIRYLWAHTCFVDNFVSREIALTAGKRLGQWILGDYFLLFWDRLHIRVVFQIYHWYTLLLSDSKHWSQQIFYLLWTRNMLGE